MSRPFSEADLAGAKKVIAALKADPALMHDYELDFLKSFLAEGGFQLPETDDDDTPLANVVQPSMGRCFRRSAGSGDERLDRDKFSSCVGQMMARAQQRLSPPPASSSQQPSAAEPALWGQGLLGPPQEAVDLSVKDDDMDTMLARVPPAASRAPRQTPRASSHTPARLRALCRPIIKASRAARSASAARTRGH